MTSHAYVITGTRVTHHDATVDDIENAMAPDPTDRIDDLLALEAVTEAFVLQTCNRSEAYIVTETASRGRDIVTTINNPPRAASKVVMGHEESLRHLLAVATGLDSQVLGEDQILGQIRSAYQTAVSRDAIGPVLDPALLKAIHVGERARSETSINEGIVSLGSAATTLATRHRPLDGALAVIIGAGEMASLVATALADEPLDTLRIVNRSRQTAEHITDALPVPTEVHDLTDLSVHLRDADVVVSSTSSPSPIIDRTSLSDAGETLLIDLAQPRDVVPDATALPHITLIDLDGLQTITNETHRERQDAARQVEQIVQEEFDLLIQQYKRKRADAVIAAMYTGAERIKENEISRALSSSDFDEAEQDALESLADSIVSQLMAVPTKSLREAAENDDWETISTAIELFDPNLDENGLRALSRLYDDLNSPGIPADAEED